MAVPEEGLKLKLRQINDLFPPFSEFQKERKESGRATIV